ncbi:MAG: ATP-binding cassette domain-containing protein [Roseburia porci]|nr:ATP-binding cassette domain-containing protein [Roseburia porci]
MGNSGCGKSTLIRILEGVEKPDDGLVTLGKEILSSSPSKARQKKFGIVYQSDNLLEWLSVYKNVELPLSTFKMKNGKEKDKEKIMDVLTTVGLENFSDCLPRELSGGMRQRCAIARALVTERVVRLE